MYKYAISTGVLLAILFATGFSYAAKDTVSADLEVEPVAYAFGGASATLGLEVGDWHYGLEAFTLDIPTSLHGQDSFEADLGGAEIQAEYQFSERSGFFAGPEVGVSQLRLQHTDYDQKKDRIQYSVGLRGGYRWYPGIGNLYISPLLGVGYSLNSENIDIRGDTFRSAPLTPFATVALGWQFEVAGAE